ncbi:phage tail sheath subtilisin-like domain-containing protein [Paenibacillus amylolyticus]|uniref:phage tail sheath subtilisin-like domain-containing protein n=1 Tax=Paenibacillus amylolyticus TaxID=1451 RepID=UPI003D99EE8E
MAGGTWEQTNRPVLPGLYMNFQAAASSAIQAGTRGTVVVPIKANWGPVGTFVEVGSEAAIERIYAANVLDNGTAYTSLKLALLGGPKKLLAYRVASAAAKAATLTLKDSSDANVLQLDAKYPGDRANGFYVTIQPGVIDNTKHEVRLFEGNRMLYALLTADITAASLAKEINADEQNVWVTAQAIGDGTGAVATVAGAAFKGGVSGNDDLTNAEYIAVQGALEGEQFDVLALDQAADAPLLASFAAWVKRVRSEGKPVVAVFGGSAADDTSATAAQKAAARSLTLNHEGVINVGTGVRLGDAFYSSAETSAYVAGLIAGQRLNQSTTYAATPFDDVTRRWTRAEQEQAVQNGVFIFFHDGRQVKALRGVNTLVTPAAGQNNAWKKIRSIRVLDAINTDLQRSAEDTYIGKVNNTEEGRQALISAMKAYLALLAQSNVIEADGYDVILDPAYYGAAPVLKPEADQVFLQWNVKLTDVMEQLFGTFYVQ